LTITSAKTESRVGSNPGSIKFIDLFAGAGGLTQGFVDAGFTPVAAVEFDSDAAETYRANFGCQVHASDIKTFDPSVLPAADLVIGGPPCQGFSRLGKTNGSRRTHLNALWEQFVRVLESINPRVFVVENVPEFLNSEEFASFERHVGPDGLGYKLVAGVLNAADFRVAQKRRRAFTIGVKGQHDPKLPIVDGEVDHRTLSETIKSLPKPAKSNVVFDSDHRRSGFELHFLRNPTDLSLRRYSLVPPGGNRFDLMRRAPEITPKCWIEQPTGFNDVFGRLVWDSPSVTIRTEFFKPEKGRYLHPDQDRPITHLEAALIQGFPFKFEFVGSKPSIAKQIGNAVPPPLAKAVAEAVKPFVGRGAASRMARRLKGLG
jgi:DNA (cytosine-5)-methyltransferase 1